MIVVKVGRRNVTRYRCDCRGHRLASCERDGAPARARRREDDQRGRRSARTSAGVRDQRDGTCQPPHGPAHARDLRDGLLRTAEQDVGGEAAAAGRERRRPVGTRRADLRRRAQGHAADSRRRPPHGAARRLDGHRGAREHRTSEAADRRRLLSRAHTAGRVHGRRGDQRRRRSRGGDGRGRARGRSAGHPHRHAWLLEEVPRRIDAHHRASRAARPTASWNSPRAA